MSNQLGGDQPFSTSEKVLAFCLFMAGCQFLNPAMPCINLYDIDILFTIGGGQRDPKTKEVIKPSRFDGMKPWDAAQSAWKENAEGHTEFQFFLTQECHDLVKAYRDQREKMKAGEAEVGFEVKLAMEIMTSVAAGAMLPAEGILRLTCVAVKTRPEFMSLPKKVVPFLQRSLKGKTITRESTATVKDRQGNSRSVPSTQVTTPGYNRISLNASDKMRKEMGF